MTQWNQICNLIANSLNIPGMMLLFACDQSITDNLCREPGLQSIKLYQIISCILLLNNINCLMQRADHRYGQCMDGVTSMQSCSR
jgi:hypothetical protein